MDKCAYKHIHLDRQWAVFGINVGDSGVVLVVALLWNCSSVNQMKTQVRAGADG